MAAPDPGGPARPDRLRLELDAGTLVVVAAVVLAGLAVAALFQGAPATITRIAIALLFTLALDPLVVATQRRFHLRRRPAVGVVGTLFGIGVLLVFLVVGPATLDQAREFGDELPDTIRASYDLPIVGHRLEQAQAADRISEWARDVVGGLDADALTRAADSFVGGIGAAVTVVVFVLALLLDGEVLVARMRNLVPPSRRPAADRLGRLFSSTVGSYFAGSIFVAVLDGLFVLTLGLILGVPLAPVAGIWAMVTNLIPQIGGFLGGSFFALLAFSVSPVTGVIALGGFLLYMQFENNVIQPAVVGQSMNLSPPTTMVAALIGGAAFGVPGAMAVTPLVGTAKAVYRGLRGEPVATVRPHFRLPFTKRGSQDDAAGDGDPASG